MAFTSNTGVGRLTERLRQDNIFGGGVQSDMQRSMDSTFNALRAPISSAGVQQVPNVMMAGIPDTTPLPVGREGAAVAADNVFGAGLPKGMTSASFMGVPSAVQAAGVLSGLQDQIPLNAFQQNLRDVGVNLNPNGQSAADYAQNVRIAQDVYRRTFGGQAGDGPIQAFAPTGLRERAIAAPIEPSGTMSGRAPVWGQGDVMVQYQGPNAQGGQRFALGQYIPLNGATGNEPINGMGAPTPIAPSPVSSAQPPPDVYAQNAQEFKNHMIAEQMKAGLLKAIPPGYMVDPANPGAIKPIPGSEQEANLAEKKRAAQEAVDSTHEKARQASEAADLVIGNVDKILPKLGPTTSGALGAIGSKVIGTEAFNIEKLKKPILAQIGIQQLQAMRAASKNGASGFGQLSEKELDLLQSSLGNLDASQNEQQLRDSYEGVKRHFQAWKLAYQAGQQAEGGNLSVQDQAKAILAIRQASQKK